jgi:hypothetical protein
VLLLATLLLAGCSSGTLHAGGDVRTNDGQPVSDDDSGGQPVVDGGDTTPSPDGAQDDVGDNGDVGDDIDDPKPPSGNDLVQDSLFTCDDSPTYTDSRIRRIGRHEWTRNTGNPPDSKASTNPFDAYPTHQYPSYAADETITTSILDMYLDTVQAGTYGWATRRPFKDDALASNVKVDKIACMFDESTRPDAACVETYTGHLLERGVLFRPPTDAEHQQAIDFAEEALDDENAAGSSRRHTLERIVSAAWVTSGALFRTELGQGPADEHGRKKLGDWEMAQALSYAIAGRGPGSPGVRVRAGWSAGPAGHLPNIRQAAIDGTISEPDTIAALVGEYFGGIDPQRKDLYLDVGGGLRGDYWMAKGIRTFFREWLGYDHYLTVFKDTPSATSRFGYDADRQYKKYLKIDHYGNVPTLMRQMDDMISRVVAEDEDVFNKLMTTRTYHTPPLYSHGAIPDDARTNAMYNIDEPTSPDDIWTEMPQDERAGVLTHPAFLASHGGNFENDPSLVHRGKWIREKVLCGSVPDVPITVNAALDPDTRDQSARERMKTQVESRQECAGCHTMMNPLGHPFEIYNHTGFLRTDDHGAEPTGSSTLVNMPTVELEGPVDNAIEMSERFGQSRYVKRCFIRQTFRYFTGRDERARDACTLTKMEQAYDDSGGSFATMLVALFQSGSFQYRVDSQ